MTQHSNIPQEELKQLKEKHNQLLNFENVLKNNLIDYKNYLDLIQKRDLAKVKRSQITDKLGIEKEIQLLKKELIELQAKKQIKNKVIENTIVQVELLKSYYKENKSVNGIDELTKLDQTIMKLVDKLEDLDDKNKQSFFLVQDHLEQLKKEIEKQSQTDPSQHTSQNQKSIQNLNFLNKEIRLLRQIITGLVFTSKIDWYNDKEIYELMMEEEEE
ncbi:hypothetical protein K502DRAFT_341543 [Neoconidiobolus thromboides FSU 785]|nr:hypothetical protein K502DRAFT_341543 [Neoconidiobolus thromboides FSU 785]